MLIVRRCIVMIHYLARPNFLVPSRAADYGPLSSISQIGNGQKCIDSVITSREHQQRSSYTSWCYQTFSYLQLLVSDEHALDNLTATRCGFATIQAILGTPPLRGLRRG